MEISTKVLTGHTSTKLKIISISTQDRASLGANPLLEQVLELELRLRGLALKILPPRRPPPRTMCLMCPRAAPIRVMDRFNLLQIRP